MRSSTKPGSVTSAAPGCRFGLRTHGGEDLGQTSYCQSTNSVIVVHASGGVRA
jgi:hypothetical protein